MPFDPVSFAIGAKAGAGGGGGGGGAISVVDTLDAAGGTVRTITAVDISDTTAVAADVASGKYFYTADGTKTEGTASGGGGGTQMASGTITLVNDTIGNNMPAIDVGFDYSHILVYPNDSHLGYGSRSNGGFHYWTDGTNTYNIAITTNSGGSSSSGGNVLTIAGGSQRFSAVGQKVGNTFVFAGDSAWNGYFRAALTWTWVAW